MQDSTALETFRHNVRLIMEERGLTISQLGTLAGTNRPAMSMILAGKSSVTLQRAERIAKSLGVPLASLLTEKFSPQPV